MILEISYSSSEAASVALTSNRYPDFSVKLSPEEAVAPTEQGSGLSVDTRAYGALTLRQREKERHCGGGRSAIGAYSVKQEALCRDASSDGS